MSERDSYAEPTYPGLEAVARRWHAGPNAETIRRLHEQFLQMPLPLQELFLLAVDLEEGVLPLIHVYGFATRRSVTNDDRLIAGGGHVDYRELITAAERATKATAPAPPPEATTPGAPAEAAEASRPARSLTRAALRLQDVVGQDQRGMSAYFPQFKLWQAGQRVFWRGPLRPLLFAPEVYDLVAEYQPHPEAPLQMRVIQPGLHPSAPHRYADGALCTFYPPMGSWVRGRVDADGDVDDLAALLRFTATWLVRYKCWLEFGGWWPGVDVPHDPAWLLASLAPDDFCPFHMPARWGSCCRARYLARAS